MAAAAPPTPVVAAETCTHDKRLEATVARVLRHKIRSLEPTPGARVEVAFGCPVVAQPRRITGLAAHGHGGFLNVLDLDLPPGSAGAIRVMRLEPTRAPELGGERPRILANTDRPGAAAFGRALAFANAALSATVRVVLPPPAVGVPQSIGVRATTHDEDLELQIEDVSGRIQSRGWNGYVDSSHAGARVPVEAAWEALWALAAGNLRPAAAPEDADRAALARLFASDGQRSRYATDGILELGAQLATRPLVPALLPFLDAPTERTQTLAVNALATATGIDLRKDAKGAVRPLRDVTAAYRDLAREARSR